MSDPEYHETKEDVLSMLHYLRVHLPKYATPENATKLLNYYHGYLRAMSDLYPEEVEQVLKDLEDH